MASAFEFERALRNAGLRVTSPRLAILKVLDEATDHLTVDQVAERARRAIGALSTQAVYDALGAFRAAGLVRALEPAGSPVRYEARVGDNHHHLVCRDCGAITDVDCVVGAAPCLSPQEGHGYAVEEAEVTFWGTCPECQAQHERQAQ